ncbi:MAG: efflux RND transporter periplasmic adaptor subunit [Clostridia bacterium]|nr:efflux RND transporter periplasmic adaptor subunit [Clostridia bacterium]MBO7504012.1 efflux RND transporter periplasmic adaptor subunit [Clostridia bacterium]MBP5765356.1 efflux RND transporter periplasmic adaptor subunit [Clostridia bacterium]
MRIREKISKFLVACSVILAICLMVGGCSLFNYGDKDDKVALSTPIKVEYKMYRVIEGDITKEFSGMCTVTSFGAVKYSYNVSGANLEEMVVRSGQKVSKGDVLCRLSTAQEQARIAEIDERLEAGGINSVTKRALQYERESLQAIVDAAELKSKIDGVVRYINTRFTIGRDPNAEVIPGECMVVVDPETMDDAQGIMTVESSTASKYTMGIHSKVTLTRSGASADKTPFEATIVGSSDAAGAFGQSVTYFIDLSGVPDDIKVGDRLTVTFIEEEKAVNCLKIPVSALYSFEGRNFVYVLDSQGLRRECYVEVGISDDSFVEIKSGLELGQQIVQY